MSLSALLAAAPYEDRVAGRVGPDESTLIDRIRAGDVRALETVFRARSAALIRFACRLGASQAVSEEIVTDVFASMWETRERLDPTSSLDAYLFRMVRNATFNTLRGVRREIGRVERAVQNGVYPGVGAHPPAADANAERESATAVVWAAVQALPERQQTVLYLRYTRELSLQEVADAMDVTVPAVKNMLQRAHHTLRGRLGGVFDAL